MALETKGVKRNIRGKKRIKKNTEKGQAHTSSILNSTMVCLTDLNDNILSWASVGQLGFRGSGKSTPYVAQQVAEEAVKKAMECELKTVEAYIKGSGPGRESAVRSLQASGLEVNSIKDVVPIPHNGCRPPKKRRV